MAEKLIIIGTGGAASEVIEFINRYRLYEIVGFSVNEANMTGDSFNGLPVYPLEKLEQYIDMNTTKLFIAVSWYQRMNSLKRKMYEELKPRGFRFANLISPSADVYAAEMGEGNWICDHAYLSHGCKVGNNNTFRPYSALAHYSEVKNHCIIGMKSTVAGHTTIGDQVYIGVSATVFNKIDVGEKCLIGGATVVKRHLPPYSLVVVPDCIVKQKDSESIEKYLSLDHIKKTIGDKPKD